MHSTRDVNPSSAHLLQLVVSQLEERETGEPPESPDSSSTDLHAQNDSETSSVRSADTEPVGVEIILNNLNITSLPSEVAAAIKHVVGKLSLQGNLLTTLPSAFASMEQLTYLDLSHNNITKFPSVLTKCPSLVILDLSSNSIDRLPKNVGNLESLKILSISNNRFQYMTPSVLDLVELLVIQVDGNAWVYPPKTIMDHPMSKADDQSEWLENMRSYVENNIDIIEDKLEETWIPSPVAPPENTDLWNEQSQGSGSEAQPELRDITSLTNWIKLSEAYEKPKDGDQTPESQYKDSSLEFSDRSRSNSESVPSSRAAKRMGFIVKKPREDGAPSIKTARDSLRISPTAPSFHNTRLMPNDNKLAPLRVHMRGLSHDSIMESSNHDRTASDDQTQPFHNQPVAQDSRTRQKKLARERSHSASATTSPEKESASGAYFRRLSTLNEEMKPKSLKSITYLDIEKKVILAARNILFALMEFHSTMRRCSRLCNDKIITVKMTEFLYAGKSYNDQLVSVLEKEESRLNSKEGVTQDQSQQAVRSIVNSCLTSIANFKQMARFCREFLYRFTSVIDIKFIRSMILVTYGSINELFNSWNILNDSVESAPKYQGTESAGMRQVSNASTRSGELPFPSTHTNSVSGSPISSTFPNGSFNALNRDFTEADNALYEGLEAAANAARSLLNQLTESLSKSTLTNTGSSRMPNANVANHVKNLTSRCVFAVDVTRKLKDRLDHVRKLPILEVTDRKQFWDDMNAFLKGIIAILSTTKSAMNDLPYLKGTQSFTTLTKLTKELPPLIDASSFKAIMADSSSQQQQQTQQQYLLQQQQVQQQTSVTEGSSNSYLSAGGYSSNLTLSAPPTTPLSAVLGPAAMVVLPSPPATKTFHQPSPFIPANTMDSSVSLLPNPSISGMSSAAGSHSPLSPGPPGSKLSPATSSDGFV